MSEQIFSKKFNFKHLYAKMAFIYWLMSFFSFNW